MANWLTMRLPEVLMKEVELFVKSKNAEKIGITNKSQFIVQAVRDSLDTHSGKKKSEMKILAEEIANMKKVTDYLENELRFTKNREMKYMATINRLNEYLDKQDKVNKK